MVPASILILALVIFTGFVIPVDYMLGWCRWINYLDPVAYGFESVSGEFESSARSIRKKLIHPRYSS